MRGFRRCGGLPVDGGWQAIGVACPAASLVVELVIVQCRDGEPGPAMVVPFVSCRPGKWDGATGEHVENGGGGDVGASCLQADGDLKSEAVHTSALVLAGMVGPK